MADAKSKKKKVPNEKNGPAITFLVVEAIIMLSVVILNLLMHSPWYVIVNEVIGSAITCGYVIILWEPCHTKLKRKAGEPRVKLTRTYKLNVLLFFIALCFFYLGYVATTVLKLLVMWGVGLAVGILGLVFYYKVYGKEDEWACRIKNWMWKRKQRVYKETGMTESEILEDTKGFCEYHFIGDNLEGLLDVSRPFDNERLTINEMKAGLKDEAVVANSERYLQEMVHNFCVKYPNRTKKSKKKGGK